MKLERRNVMQQNIMLIMNPKAGKGNSQQLLFTLCNGLCEAKDNVHVCITQYASHATKLIQTLASSYDVVLCCGGDGTWNEVVSGMMCLPYEKRVPLLYLPMGTVNDFANTLQLSKDPDIILQHLQSPSYFPCDVGMFQHRYFTYVAAFGIFTDVSYSTPQSSKNIFGKAAYFLEGCKQLAKIPNYHIKVSYDGKQLEEDCVFGCVTNAKYVAGFPTIYANDAQLDDGEFEVLLIKTPHNPLDVQTIITALLKREVHTQWMHYFKTRELTITSPTNIPWTLDGEDGGMHQCVKIQNQHKAITLIK